MSKFKSFIVAKIAFWTSILALAETPVEPRPIPTPTQQELERAQQILRTLCETDYEKCLNTTLGEILSQMKKDGSVHEHDAESSVICN